MTLFFGFKYRDVKAKPVPLNHYATLLDTTIKSWYDETVSFTLLR